MYFFAILACNFQKTVYSMCVDRTGVSHHHKEMMTMKMNEILEAFATLARSYDSYAHLLRGLAIVEKYDKEGYSRIANQLEGYQFGSADDIVKLFGR